MVKAMAFQIVVPGAFLGNIFLIAIISSFEIIQKKRYRK